MPAGDDKDTIRERAYELWEREGRPQGRHLDHWLQAEREKGPSPAGEGRPGEGDAGLFGEAGGRRREGGSQSQSRSGAARGFGAAGGLGGTGNLEGQRQESRSAGADQTRPAPVRGSDAAVSGEGAMGARPARAGEAGQGQDEKPGRARKAPEATPEPSPPEPSSSARRKKKGE